MTLAGFGCASRPTISLDYVLGTYVLLLLVTSRHWVWELAEAHPVKPVGDDPEWYSVGEKVYTSIPTVVLP